VYGFSLYQTAKKASSSSCEPEVFFLFAEEETVLPGTWLPSIPQNSKQSERLEGLDARHDEHATGVVLEVRRREHAQEQVRNSWCFSAIELAACPLRVQRR
jgi:hypothetical protein